jgi:hypothetical protein
MLGSDTAGPKFCLMNHSATTQEFTAEEAEAVLTQMAGSDSR